MAERVCTRIGIIHRGELVATGSAQELKDRVMVGGSLEEVFLALTDESAADHTPLPAQR
jgi:ABC-2 type transport system ATP-binding protein